jgi:NAD(P)-dependent dehydrogenase (short-subunit alcohol dehydrogenase family)
VAPRPAPPFDRFDLTGRVALITGGTRGLGRAIIQTLAQAGADVVVSSRKQEACDEAAEEARSVGRRALAHACHVGRWEEIDELVDAAYAEFGRIDVLVNNAGIAPTYPDAQSVSEELWDKTIAVNLKGPFRLTALVGSRMAAGDGGSIVNITSIGAVRPTHDILIYAAAKAGLNALTLGFADTFGPKVRVNAVMPGPFLTDISREWNQEAFAERARTFPLRRAGAPEELASAVLYFASDASSFTTGSVLAIDGGAQWSLAGGGDQSAEYGKSLYEGKKDWA